MSITREAFRETVIPKITSKRNMGSLLSERGILNAEDAQKILKLQTEKGLRFGEAGVKLGLLMERDIQYALSQQFGYPYLMGEEDGISPELIAAYQPFSKKAESFRNLRSQLMAHWFKPESKSLAVVSTQCGEGRSYVCANLAIIFSQQGERTLLIDADMRNPKQHQLFKLSTDVGLSAILAEHTDDLSAVQRIPGFANLSVLPAGIIPPNPQELLAKPTFAWLLGKLESEFDIILIDTPANNQYIDIQVAAKSIHGALIVVRRNNTRMADARSLISSLSERGVKMVGSMMNDYS